MSNDDLVLVCLEIVELFASEFVAKETLLADKILANNSLMKQNGELISELSKRQTEISSLSARTRNVAFAQDLTNEVTFSNFYESFHKCASDQTTNSGSSNC